MKVSLILLVSIGLFPLQTTAAYGQSGNDPNLVIAKIIKTGMIEGHDAKVTGTDCRQRAVSDANRRRHVPVRGRAFR